MSAERPLLHETPEPPSLATAMAWEVRKNLIARDKSEEGSLQRAEANALARDAFGQLIEQTQPMLLHFALNRTAGRLEDSQDIVQETYIKAFKSMKGFRGDVKVETWLTYMLVQRLSVYYAKEAKHHKDRTYELDEDTAMRDKTISVEEWIRTQADRGLLLDMLDELSPRHRRAVILRKVHGFSPAEIAEAIGVSEANAKVLVTRGLKRMLHLRDKN